MPCRSTTNAEDTALAQLSDLKVTLTALDAHILKTMEKHPDSRVHSVAIMKDPLLKALYLISAYLCANAWPNTYGMKPGMTEDAKWATHHAEIDRLRAELKVATDKLVTIAKAAQ